MLRLRTPERYHEDAHPGSFEDCRRCRRQAGHCRQKIRFTDWLEADEWITEYHESHGYAKPWLYRYRCRWCQAFHAATVRDRDRVARQRVEKQRRKWLVTKALVSLSP